MQVEQLKVYFLHWKEECIVLLSIVLFNDEQGEHPCDTTQPDRASRHRDNVGVVETITVRINRSIDPIITTSRSKEPPPLSLPLPLSTPTPTWQFDVEANVVKCVQCVVAALAKYRVNKIRTISQHSRGRSCSAYSDFLDAFDAQTRFRF